MKLSYVFLLVLGVHCDRHLAAICPPEWQRFGESCYLVITKTMTWLEANRTCAKLQATLAVPTSISEHNYIWERFNKEAFGVPGLWIGCNDMAVEGEWQPCPLRGQNRGFENWKDNQPDDWGGISDCAAMMNHFNSKWDDQYCYNPRSAVCKLPVSINNQVFWLQTGPDGRVETQCLVGHVMKELRVDGVVSCGKACRSEPRCRSFNLLMEQGSRKIVCQLNHGSRHEATDGDIEANKNCHLFDL